VCFWNPASSFSECKRNCGSASLDVYLPLAETNLAVKIESELSADIILLLAAAGKPVDMAGEAFLLSCVLLMLAISMHTTFGDWGSEKLVDWMSR